MRKSRIVLTGLILLFGMQFTLVSCEDNSEIIKHNDFEQIQGETKAIVPGHAGGGDDDDEEDGN